MGKSRLSLSHLLAHVANKISCLSCVQTGRESITRFLICTKVAKWFKFGEVLMLKWGVQGARHKKTRWEKDQRAPQFGDFKEKQWHLFRLWSVKKFWTSVKKFYKGSNGQIITINVPASVSKTFAMA